MRAVTVVGRDACSFGGGDGYDGLTVESHPRAGVVARALGLEFLGVCTEFLSFGSAVQILLWGDLQIACDRLDQLSRKLICPELFDMRVGGGSADAVVVNGAASSSAERRPQRCGSPTSYA